MRWRGTRALHPYVPELQEQLRTGSLDRREFLRTVTLLGVTASAAYAMVGRLTGQPFVPRASAAGKPNTTTSPLSSRTTPPFRHPGKTMRAPGSS